MSTTTTAPAPAPATKTPVIKITGIGGRFPQSNNINEFWSNLTSGKDMVTDCQRWPKDYKDLPNRIGQLANIDKFDNLFFGINEIQSKNLDPQIRHSLEVVYECITDAGYTMEDIKGQEIGVYVGACFSDHFTAILGNINKVNGYENQGCAHAMFANRISYYYDLNGPSYCADTACSSSLTALSEALQALQLGKITKALVGGLSLVLSPATTQSFNKFNMLSKDGTCFSFDERANGFVRSDCIGFVLLEATVDGTITASSPSSSNGYCEVVACGINNDGYKAKGITYPSNVTQSKLCRQVLARANIDTNAIEYVECHGTGTVAGDAQELMTIGNVYGAGKLIGSVKSNMGHAEGAAGIASLIKVCLAYRHGLIPQNIHFQSTAHEAILNGSLQVVKENTTWNRGYAAINSFGFGGSNANVILGPVASYPPAVTAAPEEVSSSRLTFGRTLETPIVCDRPVLLRAASDLVRYPARAVIKEGTVIKGAKVNPPLDGSIKRLPLAFCYTGQGCQWTNMAKDLWNEDSLFREVITHACTDLPSEEVTPSELFNSGNWMGKFSGLGITLTQLALTEILSKRYGITPDHILGHSVGEVACSYADGCMTLKECTNLAYLRCKFGDQIDVIGNMISVGLTYEDCEKMLADLSVNGEVSIACHNSQDNCTLSGSAAVIQKIAVSLREKGVFCRDVESGGVAYHSIFFQRHSDRILETIETVLPATYTPPAVPAEEEEYIASIATRPDRIRSSKWVSTSANGVICDAAYHTSNITGCVRFLPALQSLPSDVIVLEVSPHGLLKSLIRRAIPTCGYATVMKRQQVGKESMTAMIEDLWLAGYSSFPLEVLVGYEIKEWPLGSAGTAAVSSSSHEYPAIQWNHNQSHFVPSLENFIQSGQSGSDSSTVLYSLQDGTSESYQFLKDHVINGQSLFPAMGHIFTAFRYYGLEKTKETKKVVIKEFKILMAVSMEDMEELSFEVKEPEPATLHIYYNQEKVAQLTIEIHDSPAAVTAVSAPAATSGGVEEEKDTAAVPPATAGEAPLSLSGDGLYTAQEIYSEFSKYGYDYQDTFQVISQRRLNYLESEFVAQSPVTGQPLHLIARLDGMLQAFLTKLTTLALPTAISVITITDTHAVLANKIHPIVQLDPIRHRVSSQCKTIVIDKLTVTPTTVSARQKQRPVVNTVEFFPYGEYRATLEVLQQPVDDQKRQLSVQEAKELVRWYRALPQLLRENQSEVGYSLYELINKEQSTIALPELVTKELNGKKVIDLLQEDITLSTTGDAIPSNSKTTVDVLLATGEVLTEEMTVNLKEFIRTDGFIVLDAAVSQSTLLNGVDLLKTAVPLISSLSTSFTAITWLYYRPSTMPTGEGEDISQSLRVIALLRKNDDLLASPAIFLCHPLELNESHKDKFIILQSEELTGQIGFIKSIRRELGYDRLRFTSTKDSYAMRVNIKRNGDAIGTYCEFPVSRPSMEVISNIMTQSTGRTLLVSSLGNLDSFMWHENTFQPTIEVTHVGLNFKDVMLAYGKLVNDDNISGKYSPGLEFSGIDIETKERVMGIGKKTLATHIDCGKHLYWKIPTQWSLDEAATVPVVYCTVYYALVMKANIRPGVSVLIHSIAGGVGQAAYHIAKAYGCTDIYATCSQDKREFVMNTLGLPADHIFDSRSTDFYHDIMRATDGQGVDILLNSLSGDKLLTSLDCMSRFGHFCEIGKYDIQQDSRIGLKIFDKNVSFHGIDLTDLFAAPVTATKTGKVIINKLWKELYSLVEHGMSNGHVKPITYSVHDNIIHALKLLASGKHIGKIVMDMKAIQQKDQSTATPIDSRLPVIHQYKTHGTHIVTGGLGGFGMELVQWLLQHGAEKIILLTRSKPKTSYQKHLIATLPIVVLPGNYLDHETLVKSLHWQQENIIGIWHLAAVLNDISYSNMSRQQWDETVNVKVDMCHSLDVISREYCPQLEQFVVYSSISSLYGNIGQTNYAYANSAMEMMIEKRRQLGLPGLAICWGGIGNVGMLQSVVIKPTANGAASTAFAQEELFEKQNILNCLDTLQEKLVPYSNLLHRCGESSLISGSQSGIITSYVRKPRQSRGGSSQQDDLLTLVCKKIGVDKTAVSDSYKLTDLGMDSLMSVQVSNLFKSRGYTITVEELREITIGKIKTM